MGWLLETLGLPVGTVLDPAASRAREVRYALESSGPPLEALVRALVANVDREVSRALQGLRDGDPSRRLILTSDFGKAGVASLYGSQPVVCGYRESLPPDHWLLEAFEPADCYDLDGSPVIVLGLPSTVVDDRGRLPRPWYPLDVARDFTQKVVRRQTADWEKRKREEEEATRTAKELWAASQAGKEQARRAEAARLQARVEELEARLAAALASSNGEAVSQ